MGHVSAGGLGSGRSAGDEAFRAELAGKAVWKLLVKGIEVFLPGRSTSIGAVRVSDRPVTLRVPVFVNGTGFGIQLQKRPVDRQPEREIFVRGDQGRIIGIAIAGPTAAIGSRVVDAGTLAGYARRLVYETLYDPADADSAGPAVRAAKHVQDVVFLDSETGVGLGVEIDPATGRPVTRLLVGINGAGVLVQAYPPEGGRPAQAVRSQN
ncbi:hypothetical protein [Actinocorallia longicatena]|uniref:Uncharacterized protein n=1 Tax=Actinocorallia longicatena TaxID=111803 RepID=A0ABP6Q8T5_9ACTN